jgi:putative acetyltransferase
MDAADGVIIRPLSADHFSDTIEMWVAAWREAYPQIDFDARRAWIAEHIATLQGEGAHAAVAVADGAIAGFLLVDPATNYLDQIVVAAHRRGDGIGDRLMSEARRLSPGRLELHVNQDNTRAIRFYERHGFTRVGAGANALSGRPTFRMRWEDGA